MILLPLLLCSSFLSFTHATTPAQAQAQVQSPLGSPDSSNPSISQSQNTNTNTNTNTIPHASQIFNALHGSMRQWDSSLHHNGMSFFRATIPANTLLYHGTRTAEPVTGMEWLAFEIEHAEMFARSHGPGGGGGGRRPPPGDRPGGGRGRQPPPLDVEEIGDIMVRARMEGREMELEIEKDQDGDVQHGYLHTYTTSHALTKLLYIDGMSAGKCSLGTLDTQDLVLLSSTNHSLLPGFGDFNRAAALCTLPNIEGFIRMEGGFEVILCNFSTGLNFVSAYQRPDTMMAGSLRGAEYARGVSMRYRGIGGGRVTVDYSRMLSAFFAGYGLNLTNPDESRSELPRLQQGDEGLKKLRDDVLGLFEESGEEDEEMETVDWQGVTDMIVTRYADRLAYMASNTSSEADMLTEIEFLLTHFIDYQKPNMTDAVEKCITHYLVPVSPTTESDFLIEAALADVSRNICTTLFGIRDLLLGEQEEKVRVAKTKVDDLMEYLNWSVWLECGRCAWDEVCYLAVWPWGSKEDHTNPGCVNVNEVGTRRGYWDWR